MALKSVTVTVVFPQTFQIHIDDENTIEENKEHVKDYAGYLMETSQSEPIITESTMPELVD